MEMRRNLSNKNKTKKIIVSLLLASFSAIIFVVIVLFLPLCNAFNPLQLAFLESFTVVNNSGQDIEIMPVGIIAGGVKYAPLPRYKNFYPPAVSLNSSIPVNLPRESNLIITYDYDDINFRHILIKDKDGSIYILDTDKKGDKSSFYGPQKESYIIPPVRELKVAPNELTPCFSGKKVIYKDPISSPH